MFFHKKAVSELTSFVFITLIVVIASISAYAVSRTYLNDSLSQLDRDHMDLYLKKVRWQMLDLTAYDNATKSLSIEFKTGQLVFNDTNISYQSLQRYNSNFTSCFDNECYASVAGFERISIGLPSNYRFTSNFTLNPGSYLLIMTHDKDGGRIDVSYR